MADTEALNVAAWYTRNPHLFSNVAAATEAVSLAAEAAKDVSEPEGVAALHAAYRQVATAVEDVSSALPMGARAVDEPYAAALGHYREAARLGLALTDLSDGSVVKCARELFAGNSLTEQTTAAMLALLARNI